MPWVGRQEHKHPRRRLRAGLRRWRYDHDQGLISFWIGAVVIGVAAVLIVMMRAVT